MGLLLCEFNACNTAKMRVGAHLGPMLEILMGNLPLNDYILCMKRVTTGADPGGGGPGGQDPSPPFWGTPKLHKEGKNVARMRANGPHFST